MALITYVLKPLNPNAGINVPPCNINREHKWNISPSCRRFIIFSRNWPIYQIIAATPTVKGGYTCTFNFFGVLLRIGISHWSVASNYRNVPSHKCIITRTFLTLITRRGTAYLKVLYRWSEAICAIIEVAIFILRCQNLYGGIK